LIAIARQCQTGLCVYVSLTLSWQKDNMGSAHPLVGVNISAKFEENPSIGIGFIERTQIHVKI